MRILPEPRRPAGVLRHCVVETLETVLAAAADTGGDWRLVASEHDLNGAGQTVVIIDSGIAYDHAALGGGIGPDRRVVGGWDFAENDADPYDDGPMGSHGTHIAGIIASTHDAARGVSPGVDLVALRVFDDDGASDLAWIEQALDWVHEHRSAFRSPITTVNLSIGMRWNGASVPNWTVIEDELAILEADGIFTAVAAGNGFATHQVVGLNYPAASPFVVPVMSVDAGGQLSSFSQRQERAIAAPGRQIRATVPDYAGNFNYRTDDFATYTGTSMAAPFVAGSSVIVRQAMHLAGQVNINQDAIESVMRNTADTVFDPITGQNYLRLNLARAIESVMPVDEIVPPITEPDTTTHVVLDYFQPETPLPPSGKTLYRIPALCEKGRSAVLRANELLVGRGTATVDTTTLTAARASIRVRRLNVTSERVIATLDTVHAQGERDATNVAAADNIYSEIGS